MLSLCIVHKWPLPSLIRICENGKLRCAVGADFYFLFHSFCSFLPFLALKQTSPPLCGTSPNLGEEFFYSRVTFLLPVRLGSLGNNFQFSILNSQFCGG